MSNQDLASAASECGSALISDPLTVGQASGLAVMFKALGDPVRLRLVSLIASHAGGEACVCDISDSIDLTQPTISHHLKVLRAAGVVESERRGTWVYYSVIPSSLQLLSSMLLTADPTVDARESVAS